MLAPQHYVSHKHIKQQIHFTVMFLPSLWLFYHYRRLFHCLLLHLRPIIKDW